MKHTLAQYPRRWLWDTKSTFLQIAVFGIVGTVSCNGSYSNEKSKDIIMDVPKKSDPFSTSVTTDIKESITDSVQTPAQSLPSQVGRKFKGMYRDVSGHNAYLELSLSIGATGRLYSGRGFITEVNEHGHSRPKIDFTCRLTIESDSTGLLEIESFGGRTPSKKISTQFHLEGPSMYAKGTIWGLIRLQYERDLIAGTFMLFNFGE